MFDRLTKLASSAPNYQQFPHVLQMEQQNRNWESFFREIDNWRNLQLNYIGKLSEIISNLKDRKCDINAEFCKILGVVIENHKGLINKINYDLVLVNFDTSQRLLAQSKSIIDNQKLLCKELSEHKYNFDKVQARRQRLAKTLQDQYILKIFMEDSIDSTMDKKMRKFTRVKDIEKELDEYSLKVRQGIESYQQLQKKSKSNVQQFNRIYQESIRCRHQTLLKFQLHISTFSKSLATQIDQLSPQTTRMIDQEANITRFDIKRLEVRQGSDKPGYLEAVLSQILNKQLDEVIDYWKDREVKLRIKKMIESNSVNPEETDELSRFVQIIKKIMKNFKDESALQCFRNSINKNYKFRLGIIFLLQLYRLKSKFQICEEETRGINALISEAIESFHEHRDAFAIKQLMVLLMTYYVTNKNQKIYIIHFFKHHRLWKETELWDAILVECIYSQKKNAMKMLLTAAQSSTRQQLQSAEQSSILNQILYIVKNMIIFDFTEKDVKMFASKFARTLNLDDRSIRDINKTIEDAVREESNSKQHDVINQYASQFFDSTIMVQKGNE